MNEKTPKVDTGRAKRVCAVVFSYFPADPRPRREADAMVDAGMSVDLICLRDEGQAAYEEINSVRVFRIPLRRKRGGKLRYLFEYAAFTFWAMVRLSWLHLRRRYDVVHVHTMPDLLVFSAILPRLTGAKIILDLHDPMPELFMTKYHLAADHPAIKLLRVIERSSIRFAHVAITPNEAFRRLFLSRSCPPEKMHVVMNTPDPKIFERDPVRFASTRSDANSQCALMYHGSVVERHGLATALEALKLLRPSIDGLRFDVFGDGDYVSQFQSLVSTEGLDDLVHYHGNVTLEQIASEIESIEIGVIPNLRSVFTEINLPTRIFEYLSKGKPVVVPRTEGILDYFDDDSIFFFEPGNAASLAEAILRIHADPEGAAAVVRRGQDIYQEHRWTEERRILIDLVEAPK